MEAELIGPDPLHGMKMERAQRAPSQTPQTSLYPRRTQAQVDNRAPAVVPSLPEARELRHVGLIGVARQCGIALLKNRCSNGSTPGVSRGATTPQPIIPEVPALHFWYVWAS